MEQRKTEWQLKRPVFLIGFMGAGKSSVGRRLARKYGFTLIDADTYIEEKEGRTISSIFEQEGEDRFRDLESASLDELSSEPCIISTGGGVVKRSANRAFMKDRGFVVYLSVTADVAAERISDKSTRPLFNDLDSVRKLIAERTPLYESAADCIVNTVGLNVLQISNEVFRILREHNLVTRV